MKKEIKVGEKEVRQLTTEIEIRAVEGEEKTEFIEGYALKFNRWSQVLGGWFKETIDPRALDNTNMDNVSSLFNHNDNMILGRSGVNLELEVDAIGLKFRVTPTNTSYANDLMENIRMGIVNQCSFAMSGIEGDWRESEDPEIYERVIRSIDTLHDVSVVTNPAYLDTEAVVGARSKELVEALVKDKEVISEIDLLEMEVNMNK